MLNLNRLCVNVFPLENVPKTRRPSFWAVEFGANGKVQHFESFSTKREAEECARKLRRIIRFINA